MMRKAIIVAFVLIGLLACWRGARSQALPSPSDPRLDVYRQLLVQANDNIVALGARAQTLATENARLKAELEELKKKDAPK